MDEDGQLDSRKDLTWKRRAAIAVAVFFALLIIFHRPLLLSFGHWLVLHYAGKENLKLDFRLEGNVFGNLIIRNLHATATGPTIVESVDVDFARADYSLRDLIRGRRSEVLKNLEVHSARVVIDPKKQTIKTIPPRTGESVTLPGIFPDRVRLQDVNLIIRDAPHDLVLEHFDLELDPRARGRLRMARLQLPAAQAWTNISGETSYANKNLVISKLALTDKDEIRLLNIDASQLSANKMSVNFDCAVGGGTIVGSSAMREVSRSIETNSRVTAENIDLAALNKYMGTPEGTLRGVVPRLSAEGNGLFNVPRSWQGHAAGKAENFHWDGATVDQVSLEILVRDGVATLTGGKFGIGQSELNMKGTVALPASSKELGRDGVSLEITGSALELANLTAGSQKPLAGTVDITGRIEVKNAKMDAAFMVAAASVRFPDGGVEKLTASTHATKTLPSPDTTAAWFADLHSVTELQAVNVRSADYQFDSVQGQLVQDGDKVQFSNLVGRQNQNEVKISGDYLLPEDFQTAESQPAHLSVSLSAPELGDFWAANSSWKMTGPLKLTGEITWKNNVANGQLSVLGTEVRMRELVFHKVSGEVSIVNNLVTIKDFTASLGEHDFASANGSFSLDPPYHYSGKVAANFSDLSVLRPLLRASKNENELSGSFVMDWEGSGDAKTIKNSGKMKLVLEKGRYGNMKSLQAKVDATYSPDGLDVPIIFFGSDKMNFQAVAQAKGETLEISKIQLDQGQSKYAQGYVFIPLVWKNLGTGAPIFPPDGKVAVNFQSENIEIKNLFADVGGNPTASGVVNVKMDAQGTLAKLDAHLDLQARDLRSARVPNLEPATFDLSVQTKDQQLTIAGKLQQPKIQPIELTANLPFNAAQILREQKIADNTPVTGKLRLPRSSVNFLRQFAPQIEQLDGDVGLDVNVGGTIGQPVLSGSGDMTVNVARSNNATLPALRGFNAKLKFAENTLIFEQFGGELSGGKFTLTGRVTFPRLTNANLDLQLKADSALVTRSDTVTARVDCDIKVTGPLTSANVTGKVALTNSQFLKNLDLIPIGLPGRPAPQPPSSRPDFSIPEPPLRDWKFDVTIKTKDPFLIRGSLANGGAVSDLHLTGTGLHPGLKGLVRLENVEATLPFSRLEIAQGFLYFDPSDSLNPRIDLHGTSVIRDYIIHVYVYGTSLSPEAIFTSEPPLPQEEIISLLATGATREELTGNNNVLAGRAATLLVQQLYRKIFKKGQATKSNSVFDRLDVTFGTVDPRTQQQQATARLKLNDQFVLMGDVGVGGEWRGMIKYLIRFR